LLMVIIINPTEKYTPREMKKMMARIIRYSINNCIQVFHM